MAAHKYSPGTKVIALESSEKYALRTESLIEAHGLGSFAEVRRAPLEEWDGVGTWYSRDALRGISDIDLLFVDGPPESTGPLARRPAMRVLHDLLSSDAVIIMDDMKRPDEQATVASWRREFGPLIETEFDVEKGASLFARPSEG
ncbi:hypothetical protein [Agromyces sp. NPDC058126]|uniref:hypothetical protein n=1 Tax=Agromyces sp. NPDC058126 TaxID=3346350 RepID=UPI0036DBFC73